MQKYLLLFQPVRVNYQSWISVPIGQSVAYVHALLSNRISLLLEWSLSKLRAQGCYVKEATIRRKSSSHPQGSSLRADLRRQPYIAVFQPDASENGRRRRQGCYYVGETTVEYQNAATSAENLSSPLFHQQVQCCGTLHVGSRTKPRQSGVNLADSIIQPQLPSLLLSGATVGPEES